MKKLLVAFGAIVLMISCNNRQNPFFQEWDTPYGNAPFSQIKTSDYLPAFKEGIKQQKAEVYKDGALIYTHAAATFTTPYALTLFGLRNNSVNYGIMFIGFAVAGYFGPTVCRSIMASSGSYSMAFVVAAGLALVGIGLSFLFPKRR